MRHFSKEYHNPIKLIHGYWPHASTDHINYDPDMHQGEYNVIRETGHDGTLLFTIAMLQKALVEIVNGWSFYKPTKPKNWSEVKYIKYTVGPIRHAIVFGKLQLSGKKMPGMKERIRMPVNCKYIY